MPAAALRELHIAAGDVVVDCTAGGGGHLGLFADATGDGGLVLGLDRDERAFAADAAGGVAARCANVRLVRRPFSELLLALDDARVAHGTVDVVFADLGVSSFQLDEGARGFSFRADDAALDMRMDQRSGETAAQLIARLDEDALADVIYALGEEHQSRRIARAVKRAAPTTTGALRDAVVSATGPMRGQKIHPATKTFQALRLAVNGELDELLALLAALTAALKPGGRAGFLTFHSLEDRLVKARFKDGPFVPTTKKPLTADDNELSANPRSRSAKLRVAVFTPNKVVGRKQRYPRAADTHDNDADDHDIDGGDS
jgi:16S rRNA (cytosine1402-N4)-methyltransferase